MKGLNKGKHAYKRLTLKKPKNPKVFKKLALAIVITLVAAVLYTTQIHHHTKAYKDEVRLQQTVQQLEKSRTEVEQSKSDDAAKAKQIEDLNKQLEEAKRAQAERKAVAYAAELPKTTTSPSPTPNLAPTPPKTVVTGNRQTWLAASGIPESDWKYVDYIVSRESSWNPLAVNRNGGACGLVQALPCSKLGPNWSDPVVALKWQHSYVKARYGGYAGAYAFWVINHWY